MNNFLLVLFFCLALTLSFQNAQAKSLSPLERAASTQNYTVIDIKPADDEWNSGEEIPVSLVDADANKNDKVRESLDLNNPNVVEIPSLKIGMPITLSGLTAAYLNDNSIAFTVQKFSDRALLISNSANIIDDSDLKLEFGTWADVFNSTPINSPTFHGFALFNYDVRALANAGNVQNITSVDIEFPGIDTFSDQPLQGLILLPQKFDEINNSTPLKVNFNINIGKCNNKLYPCKHNIPQGTTLPIVADIFGFGFVNDGKEYNERIANQIIRLELKETSNNTGIFDGTLKYTMINQLNILNPVTYTNLVTVSDKASFIAIDDMDGEESPRVTYNYLGPNDVTTQTSDQQAAPAHSGVASFIKNGDTVTVTLEDLDLNVDTNLIDIYTVVTLPTDPNFDVVGSATIANGGTSIALSNGDQLGRLLDVTFDDQKWVTPTGTCATSLANAGVTDTGLGKTGFTLVETAAASGKFVGDFQIPALWCRPGATDPESVVDIQVNYVDFRDVSGEVIDNQHGDGKKYELQLVSGSFTPPRGFQEDEIIKTLTPPEIDNFFFLQTTHYLDPDEKKILENDGITIVDTLNGFVYVASATSDRLKAFPIELHSEIRSAVPIDYNFKLDPRIKNKVIPRWITSEQNSSEQNSTGQYKAEFTIFFNTQIPVDKMMKLINRNFTEVTIVEGMGAITALMSFDEIEDLSNHSAIRFITYPEPSLQPDIFLAKEAANIPIPIDRPKDLTGNGINVLIYDLSKPYEHPDFEKSRFIPLNSGGGATDHATAVAGILGGRGNNDHIGVAPDVKIYSWDSLAPDRRGLWNEDTGFLEDALVNANDKTDKKVDLMNISMGEPVHSWELECNRHGNYTNTSRLLDKFVIGFNTINNNYPKIIITKSVGNERGKTGCENPTNEVNFNTIPSPATAKNPIVVGSIEKELVLNGYTKNVSSIFSSYGPTDDGRIKPDLVAPGRINAPKNFGGYENFSGTSFASPLVGGLVALMEEKWNKDSKYLDKPILPHTAKAILIHTAKDLGEDGPDYKYGWGLVDGKNAINLMTKTNYVNAIRKSNVEITGDSTIIFDSIETKSDIKKYSLGKKNDAVDLKLTLVWDDPPLSTSENPNRDLKNNLNLLLNVKHNDGSSDNIRPLLLNPGEPKSPANKHARGPDTRNNVEMIKTVTNGELNIFVYSVSKELPQSFTLIVSSSQPRAPNSTGQLETYSEGSQGPAGPSSGGEENITLNKDDDVKVDIRTDTPDKDKKLSIDLNFTTMSGANVENINYDIKATQNGEVVLKKVRVHSMGNVMNHKTTPLLTAASEAEPVKIEVTFIGQGFPESEMTGRNQVITKYVVPEFGTVALMILAVSITSIVVITAKSKVIPRF